MPLTEALGGGTSTHDAITSSSAISDGHMQLQQHQAMHHHAAGVVDWEAEVPLRFHHMTSPNPLCRSAQKMSV